ncbi:MAG TPA: protein kinase, partial [Burkholderiaceae bacterium]|nr:protein kinase [Burkholderiaceae bacterium]
MAAAQISTYKLIRNLWPREAFLEQILKASPSLGMIPKLLDFGIARLESAEDADQDPNITLDGGLVGTPAYMAPEQVRGEAVDARADIWGVGALLYHVIAAEPPLKADDVMLVVRRALIVPPPYP